MSQFKTLMPIRKTGHGPPLFCVHGEPLKIAQRIQADRPVYGLSHIYYSNFVSENPESIEELAGQYLAEVRQVSPKGPYHLCGFSAGGMLAYEMARQILAAGDEVAYLLLVEPTTYQGYTTKLNWFKETRTQFSGGLVFSLFVIKRLPKSIYARSRNLRDRLKAGFLLMIGRPLPEDLRWAGYLRSLGPAMAKYRYEPIDSAGVLLYRELDVEDYLNANESWQRLLKDGAEVHSVPGTYMHNDFMQDPHLENLAAMLDASLGPVR
jgi:thioesterase domain-containing protein